MAINIGEKALIDNKESLTIAIDNGDLKVFEEVEKKWKFKDKASMLRFVMALLQKTEDNSISIKVNGDQTSVTPAADLISQS